VAYLQLRTDRLGLIAATAELLRAELNDLSQLARLLGTRIPKGWPPELTADARPIFAQQLKQAPDLVGWSLWYWVGDDQPARRRVLVGNGGFKGKPAADGSVEIGYAVLHEFQGVGYATEAVEALCAWAFEHPEVRRVTAATSPRNKASIRVLEKNGFVEIGSGSERGTIHLKLVRDRCSPRW
jgi:[ribosomal protein S5]-alanine N-acetyltransferase